MRSASTRRISQRSTSAPGRPCERAMTIVSSTRSGGSVIPIAHSSMVMSKAAF